MARKPFNPADSAAAKRAAAEATLLPHPEPAAPAHLSVSQLAARIETSLKTAFPQRVSVLGEVSNFTDRTHWYFDLKDPDCVINCVMFAFAARKTPFRLEHGMQVVASGRIEYYAKGGRVSFIVDKLEPVGVGALDLAFRKLCDELRALGWFDPERKRPLPFFPRRIAIVTSRTGAALQDVLNTVTRRCPAVRIVLADVRVQGEGSAAEVTSALRTIARWHDTLAIDAILVTRGGGSKEDLWAFNDRHLAHAILESPIPVVAAIGHETDTTIAELVADERCSTPTQAAMRLTPETPALLRQADTIQRRLASLLTQRLRHSAQRLEALARRPALSDPARLLADADDRLSDSVRRLTHAATLLVERRAAKLTTLAARLDRGQPQALRARLAGRVDTLASRLTAAIRRDLASHNPEHLANRLTRATSTLLQSRASRLTAVAKHLDLVGPANVLARGYSITTSPSGRVVRTTADAPPGSTLITRLADGQLTSTVTGDPSASSNLPPPTPTPAPTFTPPPPKPIKPRRPAPPLPLDQLDLFRG